MKKWLQYRDPNVVVYGIYKTKPPASNIAAWPAGAPDDAEGSDFTMAEEIVYDLVPRQLVDNDGPVFTTESRPEYDENGEATGNYIDVQIPVYDLDGNGDIIHDQIDNGQREWVATFNQSAYDVRKSNEAAIETALNKKKAESNKVNLGIEQIIDIRDLLSIDDLDETQTRAFMQHAIIIEIFNNLFGGNLSTARTIIQTEDLTALITEGQKTTIINQLTAKIAQSEG